MIVLDYLQHDYCKKRR